MAAPLGYLSDPRSFDRIRGDIREALDEYGKEGRPLGDFLQAVIANDFIEACARADMDNVRALAAIGCYVYNELPSACWGSRACYAAWLEWHAAERAGDRAREAAAAEKVSDAYRASREWR